jgi:hypothetical protein
LARPPEGQPTPKLSPLLSHVNPTLGQRSSTRGWRNYVLRLLNMILVSITVSQILSLSPHQQARPLDGAVEAVKKRIDRRNGQGDNGRPFKYLLAPTASRVKTSGANVVNVLPNRKGEVSRSSSDPRRDLDPKMGVNPMPIFQPLPVCEASMEKVVNNGHSIITIV